MQKPNNFDNTQGFTNSEPLAPGPYICKVIDIEETKSKTGKPMVKMALDIEEGDEKGRFNDIYKNDDRMDKKWPASGVMYQLTEDADGNCSRGFKMLIDCLEEDNLGKFGPVQWGDNFCKSIKDRLIGVVFRKEQYEAQDGELRWSCKPNTIRHIEDIRAGKVKTPEDKYLNGNKATIQPEKPADSFQSIDEDVPF